MADNTRKTSNIIHDLAEVKDDVSNNSQSIQNNTDAIGNISIPSVGDGEINLEAGDGLTLSVGNENAKANQDGDTTFKIEADLTYLNDNLNIPVGGVSKIIAGDNVTISPTNGTGDVTINAAGSGSGGIEDAPINGKQYGREDGEWTEVTSAAPVVPGDGKIDLTGGTGIDVTGDNATANQTGNTAWSVAVDSTVALKSDIPPAVVPGDGNITLTEGNGIKVSGADATANQTGDTAWTVKTDNDYLNTTLNFAKPDDIPTDLGVLTIENIPPHADGNFDFKSSDDALIVSPTPHGLSLSIDEDELDFVKEIKSGNELTLTVDEVDGIVTLTAAGGGGGAGDIAFAGGKCIDVDPSTVGDLTTYTINNDLDCLNTSLGFATDQDITNAIGNIEIPEKTSDLTNDGADGSNPFITAADIPAIPEAKLPIESDDGTVVLSDSSGSFVVSTGGRARVKVDSKGRLLVGQNAGDNPNFNFHFRTPDSCQLVLESDTGVPQLKLKADDFWYYFSLNPEDDKFRLVSYNGDTDASYNIFTASPDGSLSISNNILTPSVGGLNSNDASVTLGGSFVVSTGNPSEARLTVEDSKTTVNGQLRNKTTSATVAYLESTTAQAQLKLVSTAQSWWAGPSTFGFCIFDDSSDQKKFVFDAAGNFVVNNGSVKTTYISGLNSSDASVTLGGNFEVSTGGETAIYANQYQTVGIGTTASRSTLLHAKGTPDRDSSIGILSDLSATVSKDDAFGNFQQFTVNDAATVIGEFKAYHAKGLYGSGSVTNYVGYQCEQIAAGADNVTAFRSRVNSSATGGTNYAFYAEGSAVSYFNGGVKTPSVSGLAANDASVTFGGDLTLNNKSGIIWLGSSTNAPAGVTNLLVGSSDGDGKNLLIASGQPKTAAEAGSSLSFATVAGNGDRARKTRMYIDPEGNVGIDDVSPDERLCVGGSIKANRLKGYDDNPQLIFESQQATLTKGDGSEYVVTDAASICTRKYIDDVLSGGQVPEDTIPGTGANFRWTEKTIEVPLSIDGVGQPNQQVYRELYGYDGIFTDGLHWTPDGYNWHTSDPSQLSPSWVDGWNKDRGRVTKGLGNEYLAANYISNDMKSWRAIQGYYGDGPVFLGGELYSNNGSAILDRSSNLWTPTKTYFGGDLTSSTYITVASQESGLYSMCVNPLDGTAYWNTAVDDGYPSGYTKISAIADGDGALDCLFSERMQKWMVVGTDKFWITDTANIAVANWTEMDLPTASNWNRIVDDGGSISLFNTADNASIVLYCVEPSGPATTDDWNTTVQIDNRGYDGFAGTNGRTIASMVNANVVTDEDGVTVNKTVFYYSVGGDIRLEQTTATLQLGTPVSVGPDNFSVSAADASPMTQLETQADANGYFNEEIKKRAIVVTLSQVDYDAIPPDEIDDSTLYLITG